VADFGCGDGLLTVEIARWAREVIAIDNNPGLLKLAEQRAAGLSNIRFLPAPMEETSLEGGSLDLIVISQSLHYVEAPLQVLAEAHRILRKGGRVLVLELAPHSEQWVMSQLRHQWLGFEPGQVGAWLEASGFSEVELDGFSKQGGGPFRVIIASGSKP
jgi:ArsR family transcriptional regulator